MSERKKTFEERIRWSAGRYWPQQAVDSLLAYGFVVDRSAKEVTLRAIFDHSPSEEKREPIWDLEGDIGIYFPDDWLVCTSFEVAPPGQMPDLIGTEVIYCRGDLMTPFQRWQQNEAQKGAS
jgi:hypothetical protein